jgi:hypothetical protein
MRALATFDRGDWLLVAGCVAALAGIVLTVIL